jgi:hypothetical protein
MKPSDRIKIISEIANSLAPADYSLIDLTLREFGLPWREQWYRDKIGYVVEMIQTADDQCLLDLASHLGINPVDNIGKETLAYSEEKN